jgi:hypothetical protein
MKRWQALADLSDNQLACAERDIAMMRMIAAACFMVLPVTPLLDCGDDDFSCVKESLSVNHCFDREYLIRYSYLNDPSAGTSSNRLHTFALAWSGDLSLTCGRFVRFV